MSLYNDASLVMIPSAYKDGKLYSIKPTDGSGDFTFSRGSNLAATRVDENGLIEKGRENLLLQSNQFDTTWTTSNASVTSGQSGYDGTNDAWLLQASGTFAFVRQLGLSVNGVATASVYLKSGTTDWVNFRLSASANNQIYVNLSNGTFGTISASNLIDKSIEDVGGGWYRVSVVLNVTSLTGFYIYVADGDNTLNTTNETIYIQDAQLEVGLVATDYIETTTTTAQAGILEDMPRLDYSGGASCPSLLLEPQRSNFIEQSEYYGSYWNINDVTIISNDAISPEGIQNATRITESATLARHRLGAGTITIPTAGIYVSSVFMKKGTARYGFVHFSGTASYTIVVDLEEGIITDTATNGTIAYQNIEDYGNGWYRCSVGGNSNTATTSYLAQYGIAGAAVPSSYNNYIPQYTGSTSNYLYSYGAMLESGSYPTSYIPCYGAATTRSSDYNLLSSASSIIGQSEGTAFVEFEIDRTINSTTRAITISDGGGNQRIGISLSTSVIYAFIVDGGVTQAEITKSTSPSGTYKAAIAYRLNDVVFYLNGEQVGTDTAATMPTTNEIELGNQFGASELGGGIKQVALFKTRLTNGELAALTTI